mgnify:CR=1 FL=1
MLDIFDVTPDGKVVTRIKTGNVIKQTKLKNGYFKAHTMVDRKMTNVLVHRLVALKYVPNPEGKPLVNHKDGNKENNHKDNLEWVTEQENMDHAKEHNLLRPVCNEDHPGSKLRTPRLGGLGRYIFPAIRSSVARH